MNGQLKNEAKRSGGLEEVAVIGDTAAPVTPCGRCRQVLNELAELDDTDPVPPISAAISAAGGDAMDLDAVPVIACPLWAMSDKEIAGILTKLPFLPNS